MTVINPDIDMRGAYASIGKLCEELGTNPYVPHASGTDPLTNPEVPAQDIWAKDKAEVEHADIIIAYVGTPSLGTGAELEIARVSGKDIILWWLEGEPVSRMARGNPAVVKMIEAKDTDDLLSQLKQILQ